MENEYNTIENSKSYKTEANLIKALEKLGFADRSEHRYMIVCNRQGRFTAIFAGSNFARGGYLGLYAQYGFKTFG